MRVSVRLSDDEKKRLNEMQDETGLSITALIKKSVFDNSERHNKNMLSELGKISTSLNLIRYAIDTDNSVLASSQVVLAEKAVETIWQGL